MAKLDVLVVGSTGRQGGEVAHALLRGGHRVRALVRNLAHPAAETLRLRGARLAWADLDDEQRLEDVARGVDAIFAVTTPFAAGPAAETRHGLTLAELTRRLDIPHLVYSSSRSASMRTGDPYHDSKHEVEQYLRAARLPHTIVRPAFFMENYLCGGWRDGLRQGQLRVPLPPTQKLHQLAIADLGRFVRLVLERRGEFLEQRIAIAADSLTPIEIAATLARATGRPIQHAPTDATDNAEVSALIACGTYAGQHDAADIASLRQHYPEVNWHTLADWAGQQEWAVLGQHTGV